MLISVIVLCACGGNPTPAATIAPTETRPAQPTAVSPTQVPSPTAASPTETTVPALTPAGPGLPDISELVYLDDRSTPAALMLSYFNAINKRSYLQAYSYYSNFSELGTLEDFTNRYSDTQSVDVVFGEITSEGAAGSIYFTVPMVLNVTTSSAALHKLAACYVLRLSQPGNYGAPPITPMHIERGTTQPMDTTILDSEALASACPPTDYPTGPNSQPAGIEDLTDLSSANYIDNRSGPVEVLSSLMNAINRKEYVRAFSYWQDPPDSYDAFAAGYANTATITAQYGPATPDAGAGQVYYSLPVALQSTLKDGTLQTFIACYTLHLSQPGMQGTVPFEPLGIISGTARQVDNSTDITSMLVPDCQ